MQDVSPDPEQAPAANLDPASMPVGNPNPILDSNLVPPELPETNPDSNLVPPEPPKTIPDSNLAPPEPSKTIPSSQRTKDRRVSNILNDFTHDAIVSAAVRSFKAQGNDNAAGILKLLMEDPDDLGSVKNFVSKVKQKDEGKGKGKGKGRSPTIITPNKALAHKHELRLSRNQYSKIADWGNPESLDEKVWPPHSQLDEVAKKRRPEVVATEFDVTVPLNSLCKQTIGSLLEDTDIREQIRIMVDQNGGPIKINFLFKAGLDGSKVLESKVTRNF